VSTWKQRRDQEMADLRRELAAALDRAERAEREAPLQLTAERGPDQRPEDRVGPEPGVRLPELRRGESYDVGVQNPCQVGTGRGPEAAGRAAVAGRGLAVALRALGRQDQGPSRPGPGSGTASLVAVTTSGHAKTPRG
jgi:hypothetical protein